MPVSPALRRCLLILGAGWTGAAWANGGACAAHAGSMSDVIPAPHASSKSFVGGASAPTVEATHSQPIPPRSEPVPTPDFSALHTFMRETTDARGYLGAVTLILRDGRIVDFRSYGQRDLARHEPMRKDAIFRIYSMSKTVASAAVMLLVEQGRVRLDDPVSRYLPELAQRQVMTAGDDDAPTLRPAASEITVRHLLTHTAGFAAGLKGDDAAMAAMQRDDPHGASDLRGFVERLSRAPLAADPGTRFGYDGAAIEVLARMVEVVSAQPFDAFLRERIFQPLGMRDTGFSVPAAQRGRVVDITTIGDDGRLRIADGPSAREPGAALNAYPSGAGGLYSTACDYARFAQMLFDGGVIAGRLGDGACDDGLSADGRALKDGRRGEWTRRSEDAQSSGDSQPPTHSQPSFPRTRKSSDFRAVTSKPLDSRVRGNDGVKERRNPMPPNKQPHLLQTETVALMLSNQLTMLDPPVHQYSRNEGFGFGGSVVIDIGRDGQPGSLGRFGWPGAASTTYAIDPAQHRVAIALLQHLPRSEIKADLPRISRDFYRLVDEAMNPRGTSNAKATP
ncbi:MULTISPECIES: serine hydrolase domain-containing protein [unclassified Lysobacter]|uniref:serine hydrolase domain-containing protein n=1 Tax=unclassified Lysobacter TaxID=2635362 RepID=UPI001BE78E50|nr:MULTISPECIES: serine hydrolase domain-containing protein [unclassified Lysobacter]MBT2745694.1 beta-lactamase family protein [Lysobacter sp. ISL-42]MBT2749747.1 beta-lactamase family protein [Lysobacter sp. ISL-50]MBT2777534.1 beta-lactamase family protein [Lysobacter sp. ISL-54]MBT2782022.1 beta-lactamase family protein [Lysobacter sp. ISL-52]